MSIYFDNSANTKLSESVIESILEDIYMYGNSHSRHHLGAIVKDKQELYMHDIAKYLGIKRECLVATYGGTDANKKALYAVLERYNKDDIWCSRLEHSSIYDLCERMNTRFFNPYKHDTYPINPRVIILTAMNSDTGICPDIAYFKALYPHTFFIIDAIQAYGKVPFESIFIGDMVSMSSHKWGGMIGSGILYIRHPELFLELSKSTETSSLIAIHSTQEALYAMPKEPNTYIIELHKYLETRINTIKHDHIIIGYDMKRGIGITSISFKNVRGSILQERLSVDEGIYVGLGSACMSSILVPSRVITELIDKPEYYYPIRISLSYSNTKEEIDTFIVVLEDVLEMMK